MRQAECEQILLENGFRFLRTANSGDLWVDELGSRVVLARGGPGNGRNAKNFLSDIKRAVRKRPGQVMRGTKLENEIILDEVEEEGEESMASQSNPPPNETAKRPRSLPMIVMAILTDPDLSDTQKVKMLTAYAELN